VMPQARFDETALKGPLRRAAERLHALIAGVGA